MTETMPTSEVLNRAADLIEERGWGQDWRAMHAQDGLCLMGAIYGASHGRFASALTDHSYIFVAECAAGKALGNYLETEPVALWQWNDHYTRTAAEVIEVLRACAVIEASREREAAEVAS